MGIKIRLCGSLMAVLMMMMLELEAAHNYGEALEKSIMFFEGQRSGKLPPSQRLSWRKHSALSDGFQIGVDLVGGYYDAGDNVKFNFPMAFSATMLAWSAVELGRFMSPEDLRHSREAVRWATDYLLKATSVPGMVFAQVGEAHADHACWERPEDMDTPRTPFAVSRLFPGSEVSAEIAAALAASSILFKVTDHPYSVTLLKRAFTVFKFGDTYRGSYNESLGPWVCDFYCNYSGYMDELIWAAAWIYKATKLPLYWNYVNSNINKLGGNFGEFGWDTKHAGIYLVATQKLNPGPFIEEADKFICSVLPDSPSRSVSYSPGGLLFKPGGSNMQHTTALSFLLLSYARTMDAKRVVHCGNVVATSSKLVKLAKRQVDYILGDNPLNMSYMVGYGPKFPQRIHHRASSLPSIDKHRERIECHGGEPYVSSSNPNPNLLVGAVVGGPNEEDEYADSRMDFKYSEPTTYINAPLVGLLAYFNSHPFKP
ncbi:hypothetical protein V2J09_014504 [Rumex salicifolius]